MRPEQILSSAVFFTPSISLWFSVHLSIHRSLSPSAVTIWLLCGGFNGPAWLLVVYSHSIVCIVNIHTFVDGGVGSLSCGMLTQVPLLRFLCSYTEGNRKPSMRSISVSCFTHPKSMLRIEGSSAKTRSVLNRPGTQRSFSCSMQVPWGGVRGRWTLIGVGGCRILN